MTEFSENPIPIKQVEEHVEKDGETTTKRKSIMEINPDGSTTITDSVISSTIKNEIKLDENTKVNVNEIDADIDDVKYINALRTKNQLAALKNDNQMICLFPLSAGENILKKMGSSIENDFSLFAFGIYSMEEINELRKTSILEKPKKPPNYTRDFYAYIPPLDRLERNRECPVNLLFKNVQERLDLIKAEEERKKREEEEAKRREEEEKRRQMEEKAKRKEKACNKLKKIRNDNRLEILKIKFAQYKKNIESVKLYETSRKLETQKKVLKLKIKNNKNGEGGEGGEGEEENPDDNLEEERLRQEEEERKKKEEEEERLRQEEEERKKKEEEEERLRQEEEERKRKEEEERLRQEEEERKRKEEEERLRQEEEERKKKEEEERLRQEEEERKRKEEEEERLRQEEEERKRKEEEEERLRQEEEERKRKEEEEERLRQEEEERKRKEEEEERLRQEEEERKRKEEEEERLRQEEEERKKKEEEEERLRQEEEERKRKEEEEERLRQEEEERKRKEEEEERLRQEEEERKKKEEEEERLRQEEEERKRKEEEEERLRQEEEDRKKKEEEEERLRQEEEERLRQEEEDRKKKEEEEERLRQEEEDRKRKEEEEERLRQEEEERKRKEEEEERLRQEEEERKRKEEEEERLRQEEEERKRKEEELNKNNQDPEEENEKMKLHNELMNNQEEEEDPYKNSPQQLRGVNNNKNNNSKNNGFFDSNGDNNNEQNQPKGENDDEGNDNNQKPKKKTVVKKVKKVVKVPKNKNELLYDNRKPFYISSTPVSGGSGDYRDYRDNLTYTGKIPLRNLNKKNECKYCHHEIFNNRNPNRNDNLDNDLYICDNCLNNIEPNQSATLYNNFNNKFNNTVNPNGNTLRSYDFNRNSSDKDGRIGPKDYYEKNKNRYLNEFWKNENEDLPKTKRGQKSRTIEKDNPYRNRFKFDDPNEEYTYNDLNNIHGDKAEPRKIKRCRNKSTDVALNPRENNQNLRNKNNRNSNNKKYLDGINLYGINELECPRCFNSYIVSPNKRFYYCTDCRDIMCGKCSKTHYIDHPDHNCSIANFRDPDDMRDSTYGYAPNQNLRNKKNSNYLNTNPNSNLNDLNGNKDRKKRKINVNKYINKSTNLNPNQISGQRYNIDDDDGLNSPLYKTNANNLGTLRNKPKNNNYYNPNSGKMNIDDNCYICGINKRDYPNERFYICRDCNHLLCDQCLDMHDMKNPRHNNLISSYNAGDPYKNKSNIDPKSIYYYYKNKNNENSPTFGKNRNSIKSQYEYDYDNIDDDDNLNSPLYKTNVNNLGTLRNKPKTNNYYNPNSGQMNIDDNCYICGINKREYPDEKFYICRDCNNLICDQCLDMHDMKNPRHNNLISTYNAGEPYKNNSNIDPKSIYYRYKNSNDNNDNLPYNNMTDNNYLKDNLNPQLYRAKDNNRGKLRNRSMDNKNKINTYYDPDIKKMKESNFNQGAFDDDCYICGITQREYPNERFYICRDCNHLLCNQCINLHDMKYPRHNFITSYNNPNNQKKEYQNSMKGSPRKKPKSSYGDLDDNKSQFYINKNKNSIDNISNLNKDLEDTNDYYNPNTYDMNNIEPNIYNPRVNNANDNHNLSPKKKAKLRKFINKPNNDDGNYNDNDNDNYNNPNANLRGNNMNSNKKCKIEFDLNRRDSEFDKFEIFGSPTCFNCLKSKKNQKNIQIFFCNQCMKLFCRDCLNLHNYYCC